VNGEILVYHLSDHGLGALDLLRSATIIALRFILDGLLLDTAPQDDHISAQGILLKLFFHRFGLRLGLAGNRSDFIIINVEVDPVVRPANMVLFEVFQHFCLLFGVCNAFLDLADLGLVVAALTEHVVDDTLPSEDGTHVLLGNWLLLGLPHISLKLVYVEFGVKEIFRFLQLVVVRLLEVTTEGSCAHYGIGAELVSSHDDMLVARVALLVAHDEGLAAHKAHLIELAAHQLARQETLP